MSVLDFVVIIGLGILSIIDIKSKKIPVWLVGVFGMLCFIFRWTEGSSLLDFIGGLLPGILLIVLAICSRGNIGMGDGLVLCVLGIACGLEEVISILGFSFFLTAIWAIGLLILKRVNGKTELPFLPYIFAGHLLVNWIK